MTERDLLPRDDDSSTLRSVAVAVAVGAVVLVVAGLVLQAVVGFIGAMVTIALVLGGLALLATGRRLLGWAGVGLGGLMLLGQLPVVLLVALVGGVIWLIAR